MTNGRPADTESRLSRLEEVFISAGEYLTHTSRLAQENAAAIDRTNANIDRTNANIDRTNANIDRNTANINLLGQRIDRLTETVDRVVNRIDSLAAASERHDRILDYLIGQQQTNDS